jgi:hypothetical protein
MITSPEIRRLEHEGVQVDTPDNQTVPCQHGGARRHGHIELDEQKFEKLKCIRHGIRAQRKGKRKRKRKDKRKVSGSRSSPSGTNTVDDKICRAWRKGHPCPRLGNGLPCPWEHPGDIFSTAGSNIEKIDVNVAIWAGNLFPFVGGARTSSCSADPPHNSRDGADKKEAIGSSFLAKTKRPISCGSTET